MNARRMRLSVVAALMLAAPVSVFARDAALEMAKVPADARGVCLVLDCGGGERVAAIARETGMFVFAIAKDDKVCAAARKRLDAAGLYGTRAAVMTGSLRRLPLPTGYGNLVVARAFANGLSEAEVRRVLNPNGVAVIGTRVFTGVPSEGVDSWTHDRHDPSNTAVSAETTVRPPFRTQWIAGPGHAVNAMTLVSGGRLIIIDAPTGRRARPKLYARDASNGMLLWVRALKPPAPLRRGIALVDDHICLVDEGKRIVMLDASTGKEVKSFEPDVKSGITGRILRVSITDGIAYGLAGGAAEGKLLFRGVGPRGDCVFAMALADGRVLWSRRTEKPVLERSISLGGGALYGYAPELGVVALDLATGTERWRNAETVALMKKGGATGWMTAGSWSVYHNGKVLFYAISTPVALDATSGKILWTNKHYRAPLCVGDRIYTYTRSGDSIIAVDPATGKNVGRLNMPTAMAGCGSGTASATCIYSAGQGFGTFDFPTNTYHAYNVYRTPCGIGSIAANGMLYTTPFTCNCNYSITGQVCVAPVARDAAPDARDGAGRLHRGAAFGRPLAPPDLDAWRTYRHDARHSAVTIGKPTLPLKLGWQRKLTGKITAPAAADGRVFIGSDRGHVHALDATTGEPRWTFLCGASVPVTPTVWRGRVFVGSHDGWVYCLEAATGKLVWRFRAADDERYVHITGRMISAWPVQTGVIVEDDVAYVASGLCSYDGSTLWALDAATGAVKYAKAVGNLNGLGAGINPQGPLAADGERLIIPTGGSQAAGVRRSDGKVLWWRGSLKYRERTGVRYAKFNYSGGSEILIEGNAFLVGGPRLVGDRGYPFLISGTDDGYPLGTQKAFKAGKAPLAKNGLLWEYYIAPTYGRSTGLLTPVLTADRVYLPMVRRVDVCDRAKLTAVHLAGPDKKMRADAAKAAVSYSLKVPAESVVLAGDVLLAACRQELAAVEDKPDGKTLGRVALPARPIRNGVAVSAGAVFVVTADGTVLRAN